jgi:hypothetical protein
MVIRLRPFYHELERVVCRLDRKEKKARIARTITQVDFISAASFSLAQRINLL